MKLSKLQSIKRETERFTEKLNEAIARAYSNDKTSRYSDGKHVDVEIPEADRDCTKTKESASLKRAAMDLKNELSNLNQIR